MKVFNRRTLFVACYAFLVSFYIFSSGFSLYLLLLLSAGLSLMSIVSRTKTGCSTVIFIPFIVLIMLILTSRIAQVEPEKSIIFVLAAIGVVISTVEKRSVSLVGVVLMGISLYVNPTIGLRYDALFFLGIIVAWLIIFSEKIPFLTLALFTSLALVFILFTPELDSGIESFFAKETTAASTATVTPENPTAPLNANTFFNYSDDGEQSRRVTMSFSEMDTGGADDSIFYFILLTTIGPLIYALLFKVVKLKKVWKSNLLMTLIIAGIIAIGIGSFMWFRDQPDNPLLSNAGSTGQLAAQSAIQSSSNPTQTGTSKILEEIRLETNYLNWLMYAGAILLFLGFTLPVFISIMRISKKEQPKAVEAKLPEGIKVLPLDKLPELAFDRDYILSAYWWLRRRHFSGSNSLTPYEVLKVISEEYTEIIPLIVEITERYVLTRYGGRNVEKRDCRRFNDLLLKAHAFFEMESEKSENN